MAALCDGHCILRVQAEIRVPAASLDCCNRVDCGICQFDAMVSFEPSDRVYPVARKLFTEGCDISDWFGCLVCGVEFVVSEYEKAGPGYALYFLAWMQYDGDLCHTRNGHLNIAFQLI